MHGAPSHSRAKQAPRGRGYPPGTPAPVRSTRVRACAYIETSRRAEPEAEPEAEPGPEPGPEPEPELESEPEPAPELEPEPEPEQVHESHYDQKKLKKNFSENSYNSVPTVQK